MTDERKRDLDEPNQVLENLIFKSLLFALFKKDSNVFQITDY